MKEGQMFARVTLFEIDTLRTTIDDVQRLFDEEVLPLVEQQPGFAGCYVLRTPEGKGMVITLWQSEEAARSGIESGYYQEQLAKFVTFMRQPPGREHYEVVDARVRPGALSETGA
jgi:heme-degrading monooxygenase HmoA